MRMNCIVIAFVSLIFLPASRLVAETNSALFSARASVTVEELREHIETLASDAFEGREAGRRGGHAAAAYIRQALKKSGLRPAGPAKSYYQSFGPGYRNILALVPGSDPERAGEYVIVTSHYDHVGFGNRRNSNGPVGYIHNGADDNASGVATVLEVADALQQYTPGLARSVLFVFWDAEEKGLLGSKHWLRQPTIDLRQIRLMINTDMVGRLRGQRLSLVGTRSMAGLRAGWSRANLDDNLQLDFPWKLLDNSDHYPFFLRRIPITMLHTGLHDDYHTPRDDSHKLNVYGIHAVCDLLLNFLVSVADQRDLDAFRAASMHETASAQAQFERPVSRRPTRLGVSWDPQRSSGDAGVVVRHVWADSAAQRAGIRPGDAILGVDGRQLAGAEALRRAIRMAPETIWLTIARGGEELSIRVELDGSPSRVGISWRTDSAEPGVMILSSVAAASAASAAGLQRLDRIHAVDGVPVESSEEFHERLTRSEGRVELLIERQGRMRMIEMELPPQQGAYLKLLAAD